MSASLYFHFSMFDLQSIPVLRLFRQFQCNHGASDPGPRSSDCMALSYCGTYRRWWAHALSHSAGGFVSSGVTECTKLFLDFRSFVYRLVTVIPGIFCLLISLLLRCGSPSKTRWCNTSKKIYNRCWSQTSCYGMGRLRSGLGQVCLHDLTFPTQCTYIPL